MDEWNDPRDCLPQGRIDCWIVLRNPIFEPKTELGYYLPIANRFVFAQVEWHPRCVLWWQRVQIPTPPKQIEVRV